ncbi:MAG: acyl-CoA carboxylase subunit beta [Dermatophilaceae bacterium]
MSQVSDVPVVDPTPARTLPLPAGTTPQPARARAGSTWRLDTAATPASRRSARAPQTLSLRDLTADLEQARAEIIGADRPGHPHGATRVGAAAPRRVTARERVLALLDPGTFVETDLHVRHRVTRFGMAQKRPATDGVVTGWGDVEGRPVAVFAHDARIFGGALGEAFAAKIHKIMDLAETAGVPLIGLNDGGGARIQEGARALAGFGGIFRRNVRCSGAIPQLSLVMGACAGGAAYSPALTDFTFMVDGAASMFITGPEVIADVTGELTSKAELGGASVHAARTGVAAFRAATEQECFEDVRHLLSFLPSHAGEAPPYHPPHDRPDRRCERLLDLVPADPRRPYDVLDVIAEIVDDGELLEVHREWARNIVCAFARLDGYPVGIVANQPSVLAGVLDVDASTKAARFVRFCDAFGIPLVTLVDVPGFLPGVAQEHAGIIRHGAKLLYAYCAATVPRVQVVLRKAYGGAYIVMDSRAIGADVSLAWPGNEIAVMGAHAATGIAFRRELSQAADPEGRREQLAREYHAELGHPFAAAEDGLVDDVIDPRHTRTALIRTLSLLRDKSTALPTPRHGNEPA